MSEDSLSVIVKYSYDFRNTTDYKLLKTEEESISTQEDMNEFTLKFNEKSKDYHIKKSSEYFREIFKFSEVLIFDNIKYISYSMLEIKINKSFAKNLDNV